MKMDDIETFVGFYSADGYWVDEQINLWDRERAAKLTGIVPEIAVWGETERFKVAVCIDGLMLLRMKHLAESAPKIGDPWKFNESIVWLDELFDYANVLQLCIESESIKCVKSAGVSSVAVLNADTCRVGFINGEPVNRNHESSRSLVSARFEVASWIARGMEGPAPLEATSSGWSSWQVVSKDAVESAIKKFSEVSKDADLVKWLSFMAKAKTAYARNDYRVSFTLLWFVIESAARTIWSGQGNKVEGKTNMHMIGQGLHERGVIGAGMVERMAKMRVIRNKLMHEPGATICLPEDCMAAAGVAIDLAVRDPAVGFVFKWSSGARF